MKKSSILLYGFVLFLFSCSPKVQPQPYSAEVNFLYKEAQGTIAVRTTGFGKNQTDAVRDAQINAFNVILFKGIPGTELNVPLVSNENDAKSKNPEYFKNLFDRDFYKTFMMSSSESSSLMNVKGGKKITVDVKINYNSLRIDLEQKTIVRKFGL